MMPGHDGYWLIRQVRALSGPVRDTPAIAVSAAEQQSSSSLEFQQFIKKPFDVCELLRSVCRVTAHC
jgi:CheY-like chemotaxis protein